MADLVLHAQTAALVAQCTANPTHAVLLVGPDGVGKGALARHIAARLLDVTAEKLAGHPYVKRIEPEKNSISIDTIRELWHFMQLKTIGQAPIRRIVIMEHADALTTEAQNAYLKLLEEPPADTVMLLTASHQRALLPTIRSRVQTLAVQAPPAAPLRAAFVKAGKSEQAVTQAYFLSGGLPGLMAALLAEDHAHPLAASVSLAKNLLQQTAFERLAAADGLSKQKETAAQFFEALERMAHAALTQAAAKNEPSRIRQWHRVLSVAAAGRKALSQNASAKLVLTNALLAL